MQTDPASLQNLHDIVVPSPVGWWPPAPGWYVVAIALPLLLSWIAWKALRYRLANRYRSLALVELRRLSSLARVAATREQALQQLPGLLKRTALAAFPRTEVAALSGDDWLRFLDRTGQTDAFTRGAGRRLSIVAYDPQRGASFSAADLEGLLEVSRKWILNHGRSRVTPPALEPLITDH